MSWCSAAACRTSPDCRKRRPPCSPATCSPPVRAHIPLRPASCAPRTVTRAACEGRRGCGLAPQPLDLLQHLDVGRVLQPAGALRRDQMFDRCGRHLHASIEHRSEEHTSELQSPCNLVCRLLLEKKKINK